MRVIAVRMLIAGALTATPWLTMASADPDTCPTVCDRIPNTAWMSSPAVPLNSVYRRRRAARLPVGGAVAVPVDHHLPSQPGGRGDQRTGDHAASAMAGDVGRDGPGRDDASAMRGLHQLMPVTLPAVSHR